MMTAAPGLKLAYMGTPDKTYATRDNAMNGFAKACARIGVTEMRYVIASDDGVRFFPIALPSAAQVQDGICLAHAGVMMVRT